MTQVESSHEPLFRDTAGGLEHLGTFDMLRLVVLLGCLDGLDLGIGVQRGLHIRIIAVAVCMVEPPILKRRYCLQYRLLPNIQVGDGELASRPFLFNHVVQWNEQQDNEEGAKVPSHVWIHGPRTLMPSWL